MTREETTLAPLRVLVVASEAVPYAKVGGLGDVAGVLPDVLTRMGCDVRLVVPLYGSINREKYGIRPVLPTMGVPMGTGGEWCAVHGTKAPGGFDVYFIEHHRYFTRKGIYDEGGVGYGDNGDRFVFFSRAALQTCLDTGWSPDVVHCHDWMTAIIPAYLKYHMTHDGILGNAGSVLTIHNIGMGYQGQCSGSTFVYSGLPAAAWTAEQFEALGAMNLLKGGIYWADLINAVSPSFAREILSDVGGGGLDRYLKRREGDLHGILNGVDYEDWSPEVDRLIPARYSAEDMSGKWQCKHNCQEFFGLEPNPHRPLLGVVSRLNPQKGLDLLPTVLPSLLERGAQFVLVGTGDPALERAFSEIAARYPGSAAAYLGFSNELAHLVEAGSDLFLMPSRWEPCGLNQLYSLRYGTLPVVRATGGLDDTVENYDPSTGRGTGFKFRDLTPEALRDTVAWAMEVFWNEPAAFQAMRVRAMHQRFTWESAAEGYLQLYDWARAKRRVWR